MAVLGWPVAAGAGFEADGFGFGAVDCCVAWILAATEMRISRAAQAIVTDLNFTVFPPIANFLL